MKVTYVERIINKLAFNSKKYCRCGSHEYQIVEQLEPETPCKWSVRCAQCDLSTWQFPIKEAAIAAWTCGRYDTDEQSSLS